MVGFGLFRVPVGQSEVPWFRCSSAPSCATWKAPTPMALGVASFVASIFGATHTLQWPMAEWRFDCAVALDSLTACRNVHRVTEKEIQKGTTAAWKYSQDLWVRRLKLSASSHSAPLT